MTLNPSSTIKGAQQTPQSSQASMGEATTVAPSGSAGVTLPSIPTDGSRSYLSDRELKPLLEKLISHRRAFWTKLLSVPYVQESWLKTLKEVPSGKLSAHGPLFFGHERSPAPVSDIIAAAQPLLSQLHETTCQLSKESLRGEIASLLVAVPMQPEYALILSQHIVDKYDELARGEPYRPAHVQETSSRHPSRRINDRDFSSLEESLGTDAGSARSQATELLRLRAEYLNVRNELYQRNASLAYRYYQWRIREGGDTADLLQEARIGLLNAVERIVPDTSVPFSYSAGLCMTAKIYKFMHNKSLVIQIPNSHRKTLRIEHQGAADQTNNRFLRLDEIAEQMGVAPEIATALGYLTAPLGRLAVKDAVAVSGGASWKERSPLSALERAESTEDLHRALNQLPEKERSAISLRFGLGNTEEKTFREIAEHLGCSEPTAYRLVNEALGMLRRRMPDEP